jgi:hypothetical protein
MTESAFMTNAGEHGIMCIHALLFPHARLSLACSAMEAAAPILTTSIRGVPVVRDFPTVTVICTLDGFGAHIQCLSVMSAFKELLIDLVMEESNTSSVNQPVSRSS